jgi:transposase
MDRPQLEALIAQGLSLEEVGRRLDVHPSTVGYWVKKHGLEAPHRAKHAARGGLTREQLELLVAEGLSIRRIAERLDVSAGTVRHWLGRYRLETARGARRRASREMRSDGLLLCPVHGETAFVRRPDGRHRCRRCQTDAVARRRRRLKAILVTEAGGRCALCGYDRSAAALQFHHLDPNTKSFGIGLRGATRSLARARVEAAKCVLLCANCHAEVEVGDARLPHSPQLPIT